MFRVMDRDGNGYFNSFELRTALLALGNLSNVCTCCVIHNLTDLQYIFVVIITSDADAGDAHETSQMRVDS